MQLRTVTEITEQIKSLLDGEPDLQDLWVEGEVSNYRPAASGHVYFTLKDQDAEVRCVIWRQQAARLGWRPAVGDLVDAHGNVSVYVKSGNYQLYVDQMVQSGGQGMRWIEFLRLKDRLEAEGLFAAELKRAIPDWPKRIGLVTSPTGAALSDMLNVLRARYPAVEVVLAPSLVQGAEAPAELAQAIGRLSLMPDIDTVIVARGGGSLEDLWAFNDERVARAIAACTHPVVTGIGHETDFTIADFAADLRAPTPTAAAAAVVPDKQELARHLVARAERLATLFALQVARRRDGALRMRQVITRYSPTRALRDRRQRVDDQLLRAERAWQQRCTLLRAHMRQQRTRLEAADPTRLMARGYALVHDAHTGLRLRSARAAFPGQLLQLILSDGRLHTRVEAVDGAPASLLMEPLE
jgi:exodeoxyribonuclease VII large subunit